jgi:hypothetical protein
MDHAETRQLRAIGARLALFVRSEDRQISRATLQSLVADLTAKKPGLGQALGDLVGRPGFSALLPMAGQGREVVEMDALIQEAGQLYLPEVTAALREVLKGFLECSTTTTRTASPEAARSEPRAVGSTSVRELAKRVGDENDEVITWLASRGVSATATQTLDPHTTEAVCKEFGETRVSRQRKDPSQPALLSPGKGQSPRKKLVRVCALGLLCLVGCGAFISSATPAMATICLIILFLLAVVIFQS